MPADFEFIIQFDGADIPGLLYAFTYPLYKGGYNISDISLATGRGFHTTFLRCSPRAVTEATAPNTQSVEPRNRWRRRAEIEAALKESVEKAYRDFDSSNATTSSTRERSVKVSLAESATPAPPFVLYLELEFADCPGAVANLTEMLRGVFTISDAFDRPIQKIGLDPEGGRKPKTLMYARIDYQPSASSGEEETQQLGNKPLIDTLKKTCANLKAQLDKQDKQHDGIAEAKALAKALEDTLDKWELPERTFKATYEPRLRYASCVSKDELVCEMISAR